MNFGAHEHTLHGQLWHGKQSPTLSSSTLSNGEEVAVTGVCNSHDAESYV